MALHVVAATAVVGFVALGWWQLGVYRDSEARQEQRDRPAVPIDDLATPGHDLGRAAERAVVAEGGYLDDDGLVVPARVHDGVLGAYVVGLFRTSGGGLVVVLRGWVDERDDPRIRPPSGTVTLTGHLLAPESASDATSPGAELPEGQIGFLAPDPAAAASGLPADRFYPGYVLAEDEQPETPTPPERLELDVVEPIRNVSPWQNLSYWAQWWVFAAAAAVFWISFVRSGLRRQRSEVAGRSGPDVTNATAAADGPPRPWRRPSARR